MESGRPKQALRDVSNVKKASAATPGKPRATPGRKWAATPSRPRAARGLAAARLDENNGWSDELRVAPVRRPRRGRGAAARGRERAHGRRLTGYRGHVSAAGSRVRLAARANACC